MDVRASALLLAMACTAAPESSDATRVGGRGAFAAWPMPNPPAAGLPHPAHFRVLGNGLIEDAVTGLQWHAGQTGLVTWDEARRHCEGLRVGGDDDFRLPWRIELVTIVDFTTSPSIDARFFPETAPDYFWSASHPATDDAYAYSVYFGAGITEYGRKDRPSAHARCVRGTAATGRPRYEVSAELVRDLPTGLAWQRRVSPAPVSLDEARRLCAGLTLDGLTGFRVPSLGELQSLVDESNERPAIDAAAFAPMDPGAYHADLPRDEPVYRTVDFARGVVVEAFEDTTALVRCVRDLMQ